MRWRGRKVPKKGSIATRSRHSNMQIWLCKTKLLYLYMKMCFLHENSLKYDEVVYNTDG